MYGLRGKKSAFTLAETLIVMGVIGVVAALTLPNLNSSTSDKEVVTKVKKIYQNLNDAMGRAEAVYGPYSDWFVNDTTDAAKATRAGERITEFMKISKNCGITANQGCFSSSGARDTPSSPSAVALDTGDAYRVITADGTALRFKYESGINIYVDIDGPKGANVLGKDTFYFMIVDGVLQPKGYEDSFSDLLTHVKGNTFGVALYGTTWLLRYDNLDYLKLDNDKKCPNGTTPTEANPRCK